MELTPFPSLDFNAGGTAGLGRTSPTRLTTSPPPRWTLRDRKSPKTTMVIWFTSWPLPSHLYPGASGLGRRASAGRTRGYSKVDLTPFPSLDFNAEGTVGLGRTPPTRLTTSPPPKRTLQDRKNRKHLVHIQASPTPSLRRDQGPRRPASAGRTRGYSKVQLTQFAVCCSTSKTAGGGG